MTEAGLESRAGPRPGRAAGGFAWSAAEIGLRQLLQGASFVLLARLLGPDDWGLFGIVLIFIMAGKVLIIEGGWILALVRAPEISDDLLDTVFWAAFGSSVLFALLVVLAADPVADWFGQPEVGPMLRWIAWTVPVEALGVVPRALLVRSFAFRPLAVRSTLGSVASGVAGVGSALVGAGVWSFVAYQLAQTLVESVVLWATGRWRPRARFSTAALGRVAGFVVQVSGERVLTLVDLALPRAILGQQAGPVALGLYTFARKILDLGTQLVVIPMSRVAMPSFAEAQADRGRLRESLAAGVQIAAAVSLPVFLGLAIVAGDVVPLVLGQHWAPAVPHVRLALLAGPAISLSGVLGSLLLALGRSRQVFLQAAAGTAILGAILVALPTPPDVSAVLLAVLAQAYAILPIRLVAAARASGVPPGLLVRRLAPAVLAAAGMALVALGVRALTADALSLLPRLVLEGMAGCAAYVGLLACTDRRLLAFVLDAARALRVRAAPPAPAGERRSGSP